MLSKIFLKYISVFLFMLVTLSPHKVSAETEPNTLKDIAFAFYKIVGETPDFDLWTKMYTDRYTHNYGQLGKRDYIAGTREKLVSSFEALDLENHEFTITKRALLEPLPIKTESGKTEYFIHTYFEQSPPFIEYAIPGYNVNLFVVDLEDQIKMTLNEAEYDRFLDQFFARRILKRNKVELRLHLKPILVDFETPMEINGKQYFIMKTELNRFEIMKTSGDRVLWPPPPSEEEIKALEKEESKDGFFGKYD